MFSSNTSAVSGDATFVEDVFSTYLYTGNGSTQTITNGIDLAGEGGLVWIKSRSDTTNNFLFDTARSALNEINSNTTDAQASLAASLTAFNITGFSLGAATGINVNTATYAAWTFRKQPKFFDVVTYTGTGSNTTIAHSLGSVPGSIIVKRTDTTAAWAVYHRSLANTQYLVLNTAAAAATGATWWNSTTPTSAVFSVGTDASVNASGGTYVAYIYAHDAGGFGLTGTDNVISCGSYTGNGSATGPVVTLGYEPQFVIIKCTTTGHNWMMMDTMRGMPTLPLYSTIFRPNQSAAEDSTLLVSVTPTATGFQLTSNYAETNASGATFIYIAVRRGLMKVPESGATVFSATTGSVQPVVVSSPLAPDMAISRIRGAANTDWNSNVSDRLRLHGNVTSSTAAEVATQTNLRFTYSQSFQGSITASPTVWYVFKRAPGFFDQVCYTGNNTAGRTINHNLGAVPELMIVKCRSSAATWAVYASSLGNTNYILLNTTAASVSSATYWNNTSPTSSVFTVGTAGPVNSGPETYVAYLFATCPGVSKVGSYTGTGTTQVINCGFTAGSSFIMIKRTNSTGDWYVWDSARGIIAGNDPYLLLNSTAIETTSTDYVDTAATGFEISSTAPAAINANGGTFIFLAIA